MQIRTLPVYSKLAADDDIPAELATRLPEGWRLSQHQLETYRALRDDSVAVVINTAMTGDGKSLAGLLPLLAQPKPDGILALYPTNELIQDQQRSAEVMLPAWKRPAGWAGAIYGARLDALAEEVEHLKRPDLLLKALKDHPLTLANPDILHAILQFHYQQYGRSPTHVVGQLPLLFGQLTFDEFHLFETPQVVAVLTGLLFLATQQPALKTLFLSATPSPAMLQLLDRAGLSERVRLIEPQQARWYHHGADPGTGWRPILQGSALTLASGSAEAWAANSGDQVLLDWFRAHRPGAKAALIVNSVASALRLRARLAPLFAQEGLTVEANTGITGRVTRTASYAADLLIGTSTIDVGVDFRINLLVFEAGSAGTFLQRLGRLGRHTSYTDRNGHTHPFNDFAAHALVPQFIYDRLSQPDAGQPSQLHDGETVTRSQLAQDVSRVFPQPANFAAYTRLWGRFVPAKVIASLRDPKIKDAYRSVSDALVRPYGTLVQASISQAIRDWASYRSHGEDILVQEAQSFRGGSPFDCGVLKDDADERDVVTYDLFWLLANAQLELISREAFCAAARRMGKPDAPYRRGYQCCFFRWRGLRAQPERVSIQFGAAVAGWGAERQQVALVLPGMRVDCAGHAFLNELNARLVGAPCVGLIIPGLEPQVVRRRLYLPPGLRLLDYCADSLDGGELRGTVAFGRDALLLDSTLRYRTLGGGSEAPLIF